ncbi:hypothetical protein L7F22_043311 [Adiantum nelumboides]|nr:hypothetical protein [Adiantum nelumboides]
MAMQTRQDWGTGMLQLQPHKGVKKGNAIHIDIRDGKHETLDLVVVLLDPTVLSSINVSQVEEGKFSRAAVRFQKELTHVYGIVDGLSCSLYDRVGWISCKEINPTTIARARKDAIETICALEEHFPTSILNIQVHLLVHLADEVEIAGTVHARWMFFLERFMKTLKGFVRQRARPEGSMAEGWMVQESSVFISEYLTRSQNNIIELWNIKDDERVVSEVPQGKGVVKLFSEAERTKVVFYPARPNPRWWYVIQTAPRSRHIFDERGVEEFWPGEAMEEDHQTDEEHQTIAPPRELCTATYETSSDDSSNEGDNDLSNGNDDDPFNSLDMNDMVPAQSVTSTSLGINLELVLDLSQEDVCIDEISAPYDE